jgi:hypothetical protein
MKHTTLHLSTFLLASALGLSACESDSSEDDTTTATDASSTVDDSGTADGGDSTSDGGDGDAGDGDSGDGDSGDGDSGDGDGEMGDIRLVHLGVFPGDTGTDVDIFVNGEASGITFDFKSGTDYVSLPVGSYDFDIVPSGGTIDDSVFTVSEFEIAAGDSWEIYAEGYVAGPDAGTAFGVGAFAEDKADIPAGENRINIAHAAAASALNVVDVWAVGDDCAPIEPLIPDFANGDIVEVELPNEAVKLGLDVGQDATVDACIGIPALGGDVLVNAFAVNDDAGNVSIVAHLPDGSTVELLPE